MDIADCGGRVARRGIPVERAAQRHELRGARLCRIVNEFGFALHPDDLYPAGAWNDTSIRALLPETELSEAVAASKDAGFPSDIDRTGQVTLVMANVGNDDVVTLYLVDGEVELGFLQVKGTETVRALGAQ